MESHGKKSEATVAMIATIGTDIGEDNLRLLHDGFPDTDFRFAPDESTLREVAPVTDVLFTKAVHPAVLASAGRLRWVQAGTAGVDRWLQTDLLERGVRLTTASGAHGTPIAELTIGMMLAFATGLHRLIGWQGSRDLTARKDAVRLVHREKFELEGQTICIVGLGDIGGALAKRCRGLGMKVIGVNRSGHPVDTVDELHASGALGRVIREAHHVALCVPLTHTTSGLLGEPEFRAMRPDAFVYNVGRGATVDHHALIDALVAKEIAGAGLDATEPEPLPMDSPLRSMPNVLLTEHTSGSSPRNADRITQIFASNLRRFLSGQPLQGEVEASRGY